MGVTVAVQRVVAGVLTVLLVGAGVGPAAAAGPDAGAGAQIVGSVSSDVQGRSVAGVVAELLAPSCNPRGCFYMTEYTAKVAADGSYRFTGVPAREAGEADSYGGYRMGFTDPHGWFVPRYLGEGHLGVPVGAVDGGTTRLGDQQLQLGGKISGRVLVPSTLDDSLFVSAWDRSSEDPTRWVQVAGEYADPATMAFTLPALAPGGHRVSARTSVPGELPEEWYRDATSVDSAADVVVAAGKVTPGVVIDMRRTLTVRRAPKVTGRAKVGRTLRVSRGAWTPDTVTLRRQWFELRKGKAVRIPRATKRSLELTRSLRGTRVRVRVAAAVPGYKTHVFTSAWSRRITR